MKTITKTIIYLQMTALFLTAAFAGLTAAEKELPFRGSVTESVETGSTFEFPFYFTMGTATGEATHLGRFTVTYEVQINVLTGVGVGPNHFIAANGDSLFTELIGHGYPTENPDVVLIVNVHSITGGTGRFAGATGSFTEERLLNLVTGISSGSFEGTIVIHKGK